jgi:hypothetical protein
MVPLNSKTSLDMAVTVALIMCGVAPARPPAIIVRYSSKLALANQNVKHLHEADKVNAHTFTYTILVHALDQVALYHTTFCHFLSHSDYELKCHTTSLF